MNVVKNPPGRAARYALPLLLMAGPATAAPRILDTRVKADAIEVVVADAPRDAHVVVDGAETSTGVAQKRLTLLLVDVVGPPPDEREESLGFVQELLADASPDNAFVLLAVTGGTFSASDAPIIDPAAAGQAVAELSDAWSVSGKTPLHSALDTALDIASQAREQGTDVAVLVVSSDGVSTDPASRTRALVERAVAEKQPIHTRFVHTRSRGAAELAYGEKFLEQLSRATGGQSVSEFLPPSTVLDALPHQTTFTVPVPPETQSVTVALRAGDSVIDERRIPLPYEPPAYRKVLSFITNNLLAIVAVGGVVLLAVLGGIAGLMVHRAPPEHTFGRTLGDITTGDDRTPSPWVLRDPSGGSVFRVGVGGTTIRQGSTTFGDLTNILLADQGVSKAPCALLEPTEDGVKVFDGLQVTRVLVNGKQVERNQWLLAKEGDTIQLASFRFIVARAPVLAAAS